MYQDPEKYWMSSNTGADVGNLDYSDIDLLDLAGGHPLQGTDPGRDQTQTGK